MIVNDDFAGDLRAPIHIGDGRRPGDDGAEVVADDGGGDGDRIHRLPSVDKPKRGERLTGRHEGDLHPHRVRPHETGEYRAERRVRPADDEPHGLAGVLWRGLGVPEVPDIGLGGDLVQRRCGIVGERLTRQLIDGAQLLASGDVVAVDGIDAGDRRGSAGHTEELHTVREYNA
ncbi:hypothetical protein SAMN05660745_01655 [Corynebacterium glucuronolyticum]|nr:hypothetical protein CGLUCO_11765 [Corynebacterium glucuronolyticum DSM 44120]SMB86483.1 hypothetical protein SAMN05660745_01655 [Corynebacterium glucuronolyticum]